MTRSGYFAAALTILVLTPTAWGQSNSASLTNGLVNLGSSTTTADQPTPDLKDVIEQQVRNSISQLIVEVIQQFFTQLRTALGLSAVGTDETVDPTTDPLSLLQTTVEDGIGGPLGG